MEIPYPPFLEISQVLCLVYVGYFVIKGKQHLKLWSLLGDLERIFKRGKS